MGVRCAVVGCTAIKGRGTESFFSFPIPCPLSWITVVGKEGKTTEKFSDLFHNESLKMHAYKGFYQGWGNSFNRHIFYYIINHIILYYNLSTV